MINKKHRSKTLWVIPILILLVACQPAIGPTGAVETGAQVTETEAVTVTDSPTPQEPLIVLIDNDEGPLTPANYNTFIGLWMLGWVYDSLMIRTPDLGTVPWLATAATPSEDGLTWEVGLREDVTWHDGEPFTAEDVVFSYTFLNEAGRAPGLTNLASIDAIGDYQLEINLSAPNPFFLEEGLAATYILPQHIWKDETPISGELSQFQGMIGTGPYSLVEIDPGEAYTFEANPDYFRGAPRVEAIIARVVKDRTQQFNQLQTGAASAVLSAVTPALVEQLSDNPDIALAQGSDFFNYILYMNGSRQPFDNSDVRRAISLAIDTQMLVDVILLGQGTPLPQNWYHPDLPWSINVPSEFDPASAGELLDAAGLLDEDGDGIREFEGVNTAFEILCDINNPVEVRTAELIAGWLGDVGIGASSRCQDIDTSVAQIWPNFVAVPNPDYDLAIWGWSAVPQFRHGFITGLFNCDFGGVGWGNMTGFCDETFDDIMAELVSLSDLERVDELSREFQERFVEIIPWVPLMSPNGNFAYRPADYDGWVYFNGTGIVTVWSFLHEE